MNTHTQTYLACLPHNWKIRIMPPYLLRYSGTNNLLFKRLLLPVIFLFSSCCDGEREGEREGERGRERERRRGWGSWKLLHTCFKRWYRVCALQPVRTDTPGLISWAEVVISGNRRDSRCQQWEIVSANVVKESFYLQRAPPSLSFCLFIFYRPLLSQSSSFIPFHLIKIVVPTWQGATII